MDKNIAVRPEALIEARYDFSSKENDLLDMILTTIKNDDSLEYIIDISDYMKYYNSSSVATNITRDFEKVVRNIRNKGVEINMKNGDWSYFNLFSRIDYRKGTVKFTLTSEMKIFFIELKKRIYYDIKYPLNFRCKYSKRMYYFLKSFEDTGWRIDFVEDIRKKMKCPASYEKYSLFKKNVLEPAYAEINKSDLRFDYEEVKNNHGSVEKLKFTIRKKQSSHPKIEDNKEKETILRLIKNVVKEPIPEEILWDLYTNICHNDVSVLFKAYYASETQGHNIADLVPWLKEVCKRIQNGQFITPIAKVSKKKPGGTFSNYDQRTYDIKDLENKLLGRE